MKIIILEQSHVNHHVTLMRIIIIFNIIIMEQKYALMEQIAILINSKSMVKLKIYAITLALKFKIGLQFLNIIAFVTIILMI